MPMREWAGPITVLVILVLFVILYVTNPRGWVHLGERELASAEGGTWGVPRSGLIFVREGPALALTARMPWMEGMPEGAEELHTYQQGDYELIKQHFEAAGIPVVDRTAAERNGHP